MAAPTLQAQGTVANVTTGNLTVTLPAHQIDDILVVTVVGWVPNTTSGTNVLAAPDGWTKSTTVTLINTTIDGEWAIFWKRATSASETSPTFVRPSGWDTGPDTAFGGRAYVVRGCVTSGDPWDQLVATSLLTTANQNFSAVTVSGIDRQVINFFTCSDNQTIGIAPTNWTAGTSATDGGGTDVGFQTYRRTSSTSTTAAAPTIDLPGAGGYVYFGVSFKPPVTLVQRTGTGSGTGSATAPRKFTAKRTVSNQGTGSSNATRKTTSLRTAAGNGAGQSSAPGIVTKLRSATGTGAGESTSTELVLKSRSAIGDGTSSSTAASKLTALRSATGAGAGSSSTSEAVTYLRSANGSGFSSSTVTEKTTHLRLVNGTGEGSATTSTLRTSPRTASGSGAGTSNSTQLHLVPRGGAASATGTSTTSSLHVSMRTATGSGQGTESTVDDVTKQRTASGEGLSSSSSSEIIVSLRTATGAGVGTSTTETAYWHVRTAANTASGTSVSTWRIITGNIARNATGTGTSSSLVIGGKTVYYFFTLREWCEPAPLTDVEPHAFKYVEPTPIEYFAA